MTQSKHTQGPWMVRKSAHDDNIYYLWDEDGNYHEGQTQEEEIKNAVLMENAPKLLEALIRAEKRLIDLWEIKNQKARLELTGGSVVGSNAAQEANELWIEIEEIRAAIAKAKGVSV